jgi:hypothetical protein
MLDAAELIELAVFERHCLDLECRSERQSTHNEDAVVINYFKNRINDLKERSKDN